MKTLMTNNDIDDDDAENIDIDDNPDKMSISSSLMTMLRTMIT